MTDKISKSGFNPVKIGFCNILYTKMDDRGGLGAHIQDLSQELAKLGHDVTILTSGDRKIYFEEAVRIVQLGTVPRFWNTRQLFNPLYWFQRFTYMWNLAKYIRRNPFDVVEAAEGGAEQLLVILQHSCSVVTKLHGNFRHIYNRRFVSRIVEFFEKIAVGKSDGIYSSSLSYAEIISSEYNIPIERIRIIPYGIHVDDLRQEKALHSPQTGGSRSVLLSVGSSPIRKGAIPFIEAAYKLRQQSIQFVLLSSDDSFESSVHFPENVIRYGNLDRSRFYSLLSDVDVVVFPSKFESFGIAAYEAMLLGKIVILSKNVPLEGTAKKYNRYLLLENLSGDALAEAIEKVVGGKIRFPSPDGGVLKQMKEEYDIRNVATTVLTFYKDVLSQRKQVNAISEVASANLASDQK